MTRTGLLVLAAIAWTSCDSGGVIVWDTNASDAALDGPSPSETDPPPVGGDTPTDAAANDDLPPSDPWPQPEVGPEVALNPIPYIPPRSFRIEPAGRDGDSLLVHVVARDLPAVFGIALRIEWDPEVLHLRETMLEPVFGENGSSAIYKAAEVQPGSLALAWSFLGSKKEAPLSGDVRLATLKLGVVRAGTTSITFFGPRCLVLTRRLDRVESVYLSAVASP